VDRLGGIGLAFFHGGYPDHGRETDAAIMNSLYRGLGGVFLFSGVIFGCLSLAGMAVFGLGVDSSPSTLMAWLNENILPGSESFEMYGPDETVYDFTLTQDVPRVYYLSIPKLGLNAPVVKVSEREVSIEGKNVNQLYVPHAFAVGWDDSSSPVGLPGNTVFVGHNNIYGEVFKDLWLLQEGDDVIVQTASGERQYRVIQVVSFEERSLSFKERVKNASWLKPTQEEQLTLITCWPYSSNTHRLIVVARPVS
jgi:LPXTG-site transpeptidase (sortase) family protein